MLYALLVCNTEAFCTAKKTFCRGSLPLTGGPCSWMPRDLLGLCDTLVMVLQLHALRAGSENGENTWFLRPVGRNAVIQNATIQGFNL